MKIITAALAAITILSACSHKDVSINGRLIAPSNNKVYLQKVLPNATLTVDSTIMDEKGQFSFKIKNADPYPTIYFLGSGDGFATLLLSPGQKVKIDAIGSFSGGYSVKGSPESERILELRNIMTSGIEAMDSIRNEYLTATGDKRQTISASFAQQYYGIKRQQINFIVSQPASMASVYALYQRLPNDDRLSDGQGDINYYRLVADSAGARYPDSPYIKALQKNLEDYEHRADMAELLRKGLSSEALNYPEIEMPDIHGTKHKLSDLHGKVIILDFWSTQIPNGPIYNAEMKKLYGQYADKGLAIYQVSLDQAKHNWVSAVTTQRLPWISVSDLKGEAGPYVGSYNIQTLPSNFVIDRQGNIVGRNVYGNELEELVKKLI